MKACTYPIDRPAGRVGVAVKVDTVVLFSVSKTEALRYIL
jgi:hypothetical protein